MKRVGLILLAAIIIVVVLAPLGSTFAVPGDIKILYKCMDANSTTSQLKPYFQIQNTSSATINLADIKIRYWYTKDGTQAQTCACDWAQIGSSNVTSTFVNMSTPTSTADNYLEIGFKSGTLAPGANTGEIQLRIYKSDWSNYNQSNDYSFNSALTSYSENTKVTGYVKGVLSYGIEPTVGPTPSPTPTPSATPTYTPTVTPTISPTPTPTPSLDTVIDNSDAGYTETGVWANSSLTGYNGSSVRYSTSLGSTATWSVTISGYTGWYDVSASIPTNSNGTTTAKYTFSNISTGQNTEVYVNQNNTSGGSRLYDFYITSGNVIKVKLTVSSYGEQMADAIIFHPLLGLEKTPPPPASFYGTPIYVDAENCSNSGGITNNGTYITSCDDGEWVCAGVVDFKWNTPNIFSTMTAVPDANVGKRVEIRLDSVTGTLAGTLTLAKSGGYAPNFYEQVVRLTGAPSSGSHCIYIVFKDGLNIADFDWFKLIVDRYPAPTTPTMPVTPTPMPSPTPMP